MGLLKEKGGGVQKGIVGGRREKRKGPGCSTQSGRKGSRKSPAEGRKPFEKKKRGKTYRSQKKIARIKLVGPKKREGGMWSKNTQGKGWGRKGSRIQIVGKDLENSDG